MDIEEPSSDLKWIDMLKEFQDMEKHDIIEGELTTPLTPFKDRVDEHR